MPASPLEERLENQALSVDLREAVMACLSGGESRRWTIAELLERFKNLGICASRASVTAALAELGLELELSGWAPWRLHERGTEWILAPKSELLELSSGSLRWNRMSAFLELAVSRAMLRYCVYIFRYTFIDVCLGSPGGSTKRAFWRIGFAISQAIHAPRLLDIEFQPDKCGQIR
jgi:hypothetical protein